MRGEIFEISESSAPRFKARKHTAGQRVPHQHLRFRLGEDGAAFDVTAETAHAQQQSLAIIFFDTIKLEIEGDQAAGQKHKDIRQIKI